MIFGFRGREVWNQLKKDYFMEGRDDFDRPVNRSDQELMEKLSAYQPTTPNAGELAQRQTTHKPKCTRIRPSSCISQNSTRVSQCSFKKRRQPCSCHNSLTDQVRQCSNRLKHDRQHDAKINAAAGTSKSAVTRSTASGKHW